MLIPSTWTHRLTRAYTSTLNTPPGVSQTYSSCLVWETIALWWATFAPPQNPAYAALRGLLLLRPLQVDHAETVQGDKGLLGIILEVLANDEYCLAVTEATRVRVRDVGR